MAQYESSTFCIPYSQERVYAKLEELNLEEDLSIAKLLYYKVIENDNGQKFVLEEDEKVYNELFDKGEKLI